MDKFRGKSATMNIPVFQMEFGFELMLIELPSSKKNAKKTTVCLILLCCKMYIGEVFIEYLN